MDILSNKFLSHELFVSYNAIVQILPPPLMEVGASCTRYKAIVPVLPTENFINIYNEWGLKHVQNVIE